METIKSNVIIELEFITYRQVSNIRRTLVGS